jgi:acetylornithine/N-succinyldiaminopimelate aminotransferase
LNSDQEKLMRSDETIKTENDHMPPFFAKTPISVERGEGVHVWDEEGNRYLDFTSGWGVTCLGHAHPAITSALLQQSCKIIQNPNSGLTYSPVRAQLLSLMRRILPPLLTRVFFTNSGAEANDAAIKLARKATGRLDVISTHLSFHGRTISTASATGQYKHRGRYKPLMPNYRFISYDSAAELEAALDSNVAAVILEPIQGEGGVRVPSDGYLQDVSRLCKANGSLLIVDEIQTGFCRTGPMFATGPMDIEADFMTMAKGIAGGYPFGAFALTEAVSAQLELGDHGGTYCGNPLGCSVACAVITRLLEDGISNNVAEVGGYALDVMQGWRNGCSPLVKDVRGRGLLLAIELNDDETAGRIIDACLRRGLFVTRTQGKCIRVFPALNITKEETDEGLDMLHRAIIETMEVDG